MRCGQASLSALIAHPDYVLNVHLLLDAVKAAQAEIQHYEFTMLTVLPAPAAQSILAPLLDDILKTQRSTGLWKKDDAERKSFWLLLALAHANLLEQLLCSHAFRYDPFKPFSASSDLFGYVIRRDISKAPINTDQELRVNLTRVIYQGQARDGSWDQSVILTCKMLDELCLLNEPPDMPEMKQAAAWLFSTFQADVSGHSTKGVYGIPAHSMFSTSDRGEEFRVAKNERDEWDPKQLCYNHLPMIQNGSAILTLIRMGYAGDERVRKACANLYNLHQLYGGWCQSNIRDAFFKKMKQMENAS
jgi:hypothetical protein